MNQTEGSSTRNTAGAATGAAGISRARLQRLLDDPEALLWRHIGRPIKIDRGSLLVRAELAMAEKTIPVAYKRCGPRSVWKALCSLFRPSEARRDWNRARELVARGISTARPIVAIEPSLWCLNRQSYLATEWIESVENLHLFAWRLAEDPLPQRLRRAAICAESLGRLVGRMHARGISHRDLKGSNLLVRQQDDNLGDWPTVTYLIDMGGVRVIRRNPLRRTAGRHAADLARLAVSIEAHPWVTRSICLRFIQAYQAELPKPLPWKDLWRRVADRSRRLVEKKRRRGRPVL